MNKPVLAVSVSLAFLLSVPAAFAAEDKTYCSLPGLLVATDPSGDAAFIGVPTPIPGFDIQDVYVAEVPNDDNVEKVYFTMKIDRQAAAATPGASYEISFMLKDGVDRFLKYKPYPPPSQLNAVFSGIDLTFAYGHNSTDSTGNHFSIDGPTDPESSASADGTITFVLSTKQIKGLKKGELITNISGLSQINTEAFTFNDDASTEAGVYEIKGNDSCKTKKSAEDKSAMVEDRSATNFGGALGLVNLLMLPAALLRRRVRR